MLHVHLRKISCLYVKSHNPAKFLLFATLLKEKESLLDGSTCRLELITALLIEVFLFSLKTKFLPWEEVLRNFFKARHSKLLSGGIWLAFFQCDKMSEEKDNHTVVIVVTAR